MTMFMIYSYDREYILFSTVFAALGTAICSKIILTQLTVLAETDVTNGNADGDDEQAREEKDATAVVQGPTSNPLSLRFLHEYVSMRMPFELFGGYLVCLVFMYFNTLMHLFGLNPKVNRKRTLFGFLLRQVSLIFQHQHQ